jgi:hypothetical protein
VIGVISKPDQRAVVEEFFQLFKTPWEFYQPGRAYDVVLVTTAEVPDVEAKLLIVFGADAKGSDANNGVITGPRWHDAFLNCSEMRVPIYSGLLTFDRTSAGSPCITSDAGVAGLKCSAAGRTMMRVGYDLFDEVQFLLTAGQPVENAHIPTLDLHIKILREGILDAGITVFEIPPVPAGHSFIVCLTHDIDFVGIRNHKFDHTMWGFLYRATVGSLLEVMTRRIGWKTLLRNWMAVLSMPAIYLGLKKDFWDQFEKYLEIEGNHASTFFFIPQKNDPGRSSGTHNAHGRRAARYGIEDVSGKVRFLRDQGCEIALHGIDAWHDPSKGSQEMNRVRKVAGASEIGIRMHWLYFDEQSPQVLDQAGFVYDSTSGYSETVGYRAGTTQVFKPLRANRLLELPLHIMDCALFSGKRMSLTNAEASARCEKIVQDVLALGGVLTVNWHCRSLAPERLWGEFYANLVNDLKARGACFMTAKQAVKWFQRRREVQLAGLDMTAPEIRPGTSLTDPNGELPLVLRTYAASAASSEAEAPSNGSGHPYRDVGLGPSKGVPVHLEQR